VNGLVKCKKKPLGGGQCRGVEGWKPVEGRPKGCRFCLHPVAAAATEKAEAKQGGAEERQGGGFRDRCRVRAGARGGGRGGGRADLEHKAVGVGSATPRPGVGSIDQPEAGEGGVVQSGAKEDISRDVSPLKPKEHQREGLVPQDLRHCYYQLTRNSRSQIDLKW
jgi:hypothetical protein